MTISCESEMVLSLCDLHWADSAPGSDSTQIWIYIRQQKKATLRLTQKLSSSDVVCRDLTHFSVVLEGNWCSIFED